MSIGRDEFVVGINYEDKSYTPNQVLEYLQNTSGEGFADIEKLEVLKRESLTKARGLVEQYNLDSNQPLTKSSPPSGKDLAELVLQHYDTTIDLIVEGGFWAFL